MRPLALAALVFLSGCAPRPVLYPNERYQEVGAVRAKADADDCLAKAKQFVKSNKAKIVGRQMTWGAVAGAVLGVVTGAFTGNISRGVAEGAALGGAAGTVHGAAASASPDEVQRRFTDLCLVEKGYQPIGWR